MTTDLDPTQTPVSGNAETRKLKEIEREVILARLEAKKYNRTHTAKSLGIGIRTLQRKLKRYGAAELGLEGTVDATDPA